GVIINTGWAGFGDIAGVPGPGLKHPKGIRDITEWYISTVMRQDYLHQIFGRQAEIAVENFKKLHQTVGDIPDAVYICGNDFGTQSSQFCSEETFESLYAPYYRKVNDWIHNNTSWKTFKHSCGAVEPFMKHFIKAGFDIINPVQCSAAGMEPNHLKQNYGNDLTFWGGGVDTQHTLPFTNADEVKQEVSSRLEIFSQNGGYVFNTIHNVQANTPIKHLIAMLETVWDFNAGRR
ncbi:MAG: uroporphyrinogen decarboxylase family protein, partial [Spirochaetota bacterium]